MPKTSHSGLPRSKGEDKGDGGAPLPDRTRVEPSPFVNDAGSDRPKGKGGSGNISDHTDKDLGKSARRMTA